MYALPPPPVPTGRKFNSFATDLALLLGFTVGLAAIGGGIAWLLTEADRRITELFESERHIEAEIADLERQLVERTAILADRRTRRAAVETARDKAIAETGA